ncbi:MAG: type II toxin-antitoxin system prevent-host-death family antitoxin [Elusimicrobiota bacterium]|nr:type II toxin-antitoxin system prevent-host-death family antitoxin [Elusimicrobiota bacterium]
MTTQIIGLDQARQRLSGIVNGLDRSQLRYLVSSRGRPKAVLMSISDYLTTILKQKRASVVVELQLEAKAKSLDKITSKEILREIRTARRVKP